jgi:hypothetical protein
VIITCAECGGEIDVTEARGPDGGGAWHCTDLEACDARFLDLMGEADGI